MPTTQGPPIQPKPTRAADSQPVTCDLIELILQRRRLGQQKYGTELHTHNGRNALQDALEESLDLNQYLFQHAAELADAMRSQKPGSPPLTIRDIKSVHLTRFGDQLMAVLSSGTDDIAAFPVTLPNQEPEAQAPGTSDDQLTLRPSVAAFAVEIERRLRDFPNPNWREQHGWRRGDDTTEQSSQGMELDQAAIEAALANDEHMRAAEIAISSACYALILTDRVKLLATDPSPWPPAEGATGGSPASAGPSQPKPRREIDEIPPAAGLPT